MKLPRRRLTAVAAALPAVSRFGWAQTYPTRPITLIVPIAAGGGLDTGARILTEKLQEKLRQPLIVENRPGAGLQWPAGYYPANDVAPGAALAFEVRRSAPNESNEYVHPVML